MSSPPVPAFEAPRRVLLAAPRGYCAGVERAIDIVEVALATYGPPVYVRRQIVHNLHVVRHLEARKFAAKGYDIVLVGHAGHEEVAGTMGQAPERVRLVGDEAEATGVQVDDPGRVAYLTQTTLSVDETAGVVDA